MNVFQRVAAALRTQGLAGSVARLLCRLCDPLFDLKYGTETGTLSSLDHLTLESLNKPRGRPYEPSRVLQLRKMFRIVQEMLPADRVVLDFGCGKGRVLLLGAESDFRAARGVEFAEELCAIARKNVAAFQARTGTKAEFQIIKSDVTQYPVQPDENVFFLFNPFDTVIFEKVLDNIAASLKARPRRLLIVLRLATEEYHRTLAQRPEFNLARTFKAWGCDFSVYSGGALAGRSARLPPARAAAC